MLPADLTGLHKAYHEVYLENDDLITDQLIEEVVEELIEECVEFGYTIEEASVAVEKAAISYIDEAKITYGSDTESPEQRSARAKERLGGMKSAARKMAVKNAVKRAKDTTRGVKAAAGIAASIAKDEARRAGRKAVHSVSSAVQKKKQEVKSGVKSLIGKGLRKAAGAVGKVAQKASSAASKLGEEALNEISADLGLRASKEADKKRSKLAAAGDRPGAAAKAAQASRLYAKQAKRRLNKEEIEQVDEVDTSENDNTKEIEVKNMKIDIFDLVLEYLLDNGHAETISEAEYIMTQLDEDAIQSIIETRMDPRGRPASGPMNVYRQSKPNTDPAFQAALKSHREKEAKKTPEQRKAELDDYIKRQRENK